MNVKLYNDTVSTYQKRNKKKKTHTHKPTTNKFTETKLTTFTIQNTKPDLRVIMTG